MLELAIRLPPSWPLKPADVECRRKVSTYGSSLQCVLGWGEHLAVQAGKQPTAQAQLRITRAAMSWSQFVRGVACLDAPASY